MGITRKGQLIQEQILNQIETALYPLSSRQLALHLRYSWNTIQQHCLELLVKNKIERIKTPGAHLWILNGTYKKTTTPEDITERETAIDKEIEKTIDELLVPLNKKKETEKKKEILEEQNEEKEVMRQ